jgi:hypothetical protein
MRSQSRRVSCGSSLSLGRMDGSDAPDDPPKDPVDVVVRGAGQVPQVHLPLVDLENGIRDEGVEMQEGQEAAVEALS